MQFYLVFLVVGKQNIGALHDRIYLLTQHLPFAKFPDVKPSKADKGKRPHTIKK